MPATLTDVAKRAGVSLATASRAFSDPGRLAAETRQKVLSAAEALGYATQTAANGVRTVAVVVPDISNAVFAALIKAIQERAWPGRHRMLLADTGGSEDREREHLASLAGSVDGVILCSPRLPAADITKAAGGMPLVVINGEADAARVLMDAGEGLRQAVEHLYALGHRKFAYVPGPASSWANGQRAATVKRLCEEWGVDLVTVGHQNATVDGGLAAAAAVVASGATAVIAYNDLVAVGLLAGARTLGYHCPEDVSVVGIDDLDIAAAAEPGLTSVRVAIERSGSLGLDLLLEQIAGRSRATEAVHLGSQLIVRGSTFAARGATALRSGKNGDPT
ncbi:LacI family DNA-binding transcriptional regulator [Sinomonas sp.]|uniref:LacI family DNA-binding transcriptional regulator n=1 Tax=Sinomonas sp. TaxID=1914986 RepID=UPI003F7D4D29